MYTLQDFALSDQTNLALDEQFVQLSGALVIVIG